MSLLDYILPCHCHICGAVMPSGKGKEREYLCQPCRNSLPRTLYHRQSSMNPMENRFAGLFPFERATGCFFYRAGSEISELMQDLKYRHYRGLARYMGRVMGQELLLSDFIRDIDMIVPVPMHFMKKARRGYNQTEELAAGLSMETGIPVNLSLRARRPHKSQTTLTLGQRRENLKEIFNVKPPHSLNGKHILLLDDVCTTGTTLTEAAETILNATSDTKISLLTLGVTF